MGLVTLHVLGDGCIHFQRLAPLLRNVSIKDYDTIDDWESWVAWLQDSSGSSPSLLGQILVEMVEPRYWPSMLPDVDFSFPGTAPRHGHGFLNQNKHVLVIWRFSWIHVFFFIFVFKCFDPLDMDFATPFSDAFHDNLTPFFFVQSDGCAGLHCWTLWRAVSAVSGSSLHQCTPQGFSKNSDDLKIFELWTVSVQSWYNVTMFILYVQLYHLRMFLKWVHLIFQLLNLLVFQRLNQVIIQQLCQQIFQLVQPPTSYLFCRSFPLWGNPKLHHFTAIDIAMDWTLGRLGFPKNSPNGTVSPQI